MSRRKKKSGDELRGDEWLATYSDTITLLLTFFILLYAMASIDQRKIDSLSQAFKSVMGGQSGDTIMKYDLYKGEVPLIGGEADIENFEDEAKKENDKMFKQVEKFIAENGLADVVNTSLTDKGVMLQLRDNVLFETASAELRDGSKAVLEKIDSLIASMPNHILIEGHTDDRDINTTNFPSNWELSVSRAVNVVRYFTETMGQSPSRFSAAGYGEFQPIVSNDSEENMAKNRRVTILIMTIDN